MWRLLRPSPSALPAGRFQERPQSIRVRALSTALHHGGLVMIAASSMPRGRRAQAYGSRLSHAVCAFSSCAARCCHCMPPFRCVHAVARVGCAADRFSRMGRRRFRLPPFGDVRRDPLYLLGHGPRPEAYAARGLPILPVYYTNGVGNCAVGVAGFSPGGHNSSALPSWADVPGLP